jgi:predicted transcriptional regulator
MIRKVESAPRFPLTALEGVRETREYLDRLEEDALCDAREMGASISEIAEIMGMTRQSVYNKLKSIAERKGQAAREAKEVS